MYIIATCMTVWALGMLLSMTLGGGIHAFLVIAITGFLMQMVQRPMRFPPSSD